MAGMKHTCRGPWSLADTYGELILLETFIMGADFLRFYSNVSQRIRSATIYPHSAVSVPPAATFPDLTFPEMQRYESTYTTKNCDRMSQSAGCRQEALFPRLLCYESPFVLSPSRFPLIHRPTSQTSSSSLYPTYSGRWPFTSSCAAYDWCF
jgi:hypothetical protein